MNFDFNEEQYMFQETVRESLSAEYPIDLLRDGGDPIALEADLWPKLAELGLFGLLVPEEQGGLGLTTVDLALIAEEFGAAIVPLTVTDTIAASLVIAKFGDDAQKAKWLEDLAAGGLRVAFAVYEKDGGYDAGGFAAAFGADNRLNGRKLLVAGADRADLLLVVAKDAKGEPTLLVIDRARDGVAITREEALDISGDYYSISFDNVAISNEDILGGSSAANVGYVMDLLATIASLGMAGIGGKLLDVTLGYVKERVQFGQPIGAFQSIKHRCADMAVDLNTARSGAYYASWAMASADPDERERAVSMAKSKANRMAVHVMREAIQLHGGMGYTWEMALHFHYRRGRLLGSLYGSTEYHQERVLAGTVALLAAE